MNSKIVALFIASISFSSLVGCASALPPVQTEHEYEFDTRKSPVAQFADETPANLNATSLVIQTTLAPKPAKKIAKPLRERPELVLFRSQPRTECYYSIKGLDGQFTSKDEAFIAASASHLAGNVTAVEHCSTTTAGNEMHDRIHLANAKAPELALLNTH